MFGESAELGGAPPPREPSHETTARRPILRRAATESAVLRGTDRGAEAFPDSTTPRTSGHMRMRPRISTLRTSGAAETAKAAAEAAEATRLSVGAGIPAEVASSIQDQGLLPVPAGLKPELAKVWGKATMASAPEISPLPMPAGLRPELEKVCEVVLKRGWDSTKFPRNFTPLHLAARLGSKDAVCFLLSLGAALSLGLRDEKGLTPRDYAEQKGHVDLLPLLDHAPEPAPAVDSEAVAVAPPPPRLGAVGHRPMPADLPPKLEEACTLVLERGWNGVRFPYGYTPLHLAAQLGCAEAVQWLLAVGARPGLKWQDEWGWTPLDYAESEAHEELVAVLTPVSLDEGASDSEQSEHWNIHEAPSLVEWPEDEY